eukprot:TRINITY_DN34426_c0_g1_i1.p1 TRINITY_DN34426_c0_g1~~TRINITY_DN34426_c0_g1_i1.p1  ORF type:complete len:174 (+),score=66.38 TRINITY_DN34426_c0_g1_i1:88-609(+)
MFRRTCSALGKRTEFLKRLDLLTEGMEKKVLKKQHWAQVYAEDCEMEMGTQSVKGIDAIISPLPMFNAAFDVRPRIVEVIGDEDSDKFAVRYSHLARFVGNYGSIQATGQSSTFDGINLHTVDEEGRTTHIVQSADLLSFFIQVGALPPLFEAPEEAPELDGIGAVSLGTKSL